MVINMSKKINTLITVIFILFSVLLISEPESCKTGIATGILLCSKIIIPSLYPFTVCLLFIMKSGILKNIEFITPFTKRIFKLTANEFVIMILSFVGGYPVGAKLIDEEINNKRLTAQRGGNLLCFCTNAGPAFIITVVGSGLYGSKKIGTILFVSHILSSILFCIIFNKNEINSNYSNKNDEKINIIDNFISSASESASSVMTICIYVILFSTINSYLAFLSTKIFFIKYILYILEITNAVTYTKNIFVLSFLLGFGGLCVACQIIGIGKSIKISPIKYLGARVFHGLISSMLSFIIIRLFNISIPVFSNNRSFSFKEVYTTPQLAISMLITITVLFLTIRNKKMSGKFLEDVV